MKKLPTYRSLAASLALAFLLFNMGLPIIIDSCPMSKPSGSMICYLCTEQSAGGFRVPVLKGKSCCSPLLALERNTNEFVQAQKGMAGFEGPDCALLGGLTTVLSPASALQSPGRFTSSSPPLLAADLPILHSRLLI